MKSLSLVTLLLLSCWMPARADYDAGLAAYQKGEYGVALREFRALADRGVVLAYTNLGYMYALGEGVKANPSKAAAWFRKAAEAGSGAAQLTLGVLYYNGEGVERDYPRAYAWFNIAATNGRDDALRYMSVVMQRMSKAQAITAQQLARALYDRHASRPAAARSPGRP